MDSRSIVAHFRFAYSDKNLPQIRDELARGVNPSRQLYSGSTPFLEAVQCPEDNIGVIREFIKTDVDVNMRNHLDYTALAFAVRHRKRRVIDELLRSGASVNTKTFHGYTPLHFAVTKWTLYIQSIIFTLPPDTTIIDKLLQQEDTDCNSAAFNGETPLMFAVKDQQLKVVLKLLHNKANPNICNKSLDSPLHVAFAQPLSHVGVELLLSGANIYSVDKKGQTPIDILLKNDSLLNYNIKPVLQLIAFKYNITEDLKRKLEFDPALSQFLNKCCEEVDKMRRDFISGYITVHDFVWNCFDEDQLQSLPLQIHKPIVDRLVGDIYPLYFADILELIPDSSLCTILEMTARSKIGMECSNIINFKHLVTITDEETVKNLADLFSSIDFILLISVYLSNLDIFCLIVALSNARICESMQNLRERMFSYVLDLN